MVFKFVDPQSPSLFALVLLLINYMPFAEIKDELSCMVSPLLVGFVHASRAGKSFLLLLSDLVKLCIWSKSKIHRKFSLNWDSDYIIYMSSVLGATRVEQI